MTVYDVFMYNGEHTQLQLRLYELDPVVPGRVVRGRHADPGDGAALGEGARGHQDAAADDEFEEFLFF